MLGGSSGRSDVDRQRRTLLRTVGMAGAGTALATAAAIGTAEDAAAASTLPLTGSLSSASDQAIGARVTGDSFDRFSVGADGATRWGPGTADTDVALRRAASRTLALGAAGDGSALQLFGRPAGSSGSYPSELLRFQTTSASQSAIYGRHDFGTGESTASYRPWAFYADYRATDGSADQARLLGLSTTLTYGASGSQGVAPTGTAHALTSEVVIRNSGSQSNEMAANVSALRFDMGTGYPVSSTTPGRAWLADFGVHGPINKQAGLLTGVTSFINNYHSTQPSSAESGGIFVVTKPGAGTGADALHKAATTYPVGVGLAVLGASGSGSSNLGFEVGIRVGGTGSGWDVSTSRVGTGVEIRDYRDHGLSIRNRLAGATGTALQIEDGAGDVIVGGTITPQARFHVTGVVTDLAATSMVNVLHRVSVPGRILSIFGGAFQPTAAIVGTLFGNTFITSLRADNGTSNGVSQIVGSYNRVEAEAAYSGHVGEIRVVEIANPSLGSGTASVLSGLHIGDLAAAAGSKFAIYVAGNQASRFGGTVILADGANLETGTGSGTRIGASSAQKLAFWGAAPAVRPGGWSAASGTATRGSFATSTVTTLALAERVKALIDDLATMGLIGA